MTEKGRLGKTREYWISIYDKANKEERIGSPAYVRGLLGLGQDRLNLKIAKTDITNVSKDLKIIITLLEPLINEVLLSRAREWLAQREKNFRQYQFVDLFYNEWPLLRPQIWAIFEALKDSGEIIHKGRGWYHRQTWSPQE